MPPSTEAELTTLINICHANLNDSKECLGYLNDRGITDSIIKRNKIGYFPQNISILKKYISEEMLMKTNISNFSGSSDFLNYFYLIFPIYSETGSAVGISGRTLLSETDRRIIGIPKYKNSSYKKADILYGLNQSKSTILKKDNVFVLEGYFDYMSMVANGINNSVAICGTAFSKKHFLKLARYASKITFILDSDDAGVKSAERIYSNFISKGIKLRFLKLPGDFKDIDEYFSEDSSCERTFYKDFKQIIPEAW